MLLNRFYFYLNIKEVSNISTLTIQKTDSGFEALLVHDLGLVDDRVNYQFHDFYMGYSDVDRGRKYYINTFNKNYVLDDIIITDKVILINTPSEGHTIEKLFERMEEDARARANNVLEALVSMTPSHSRVCLEVK